MKYSVEIKKEEYTETVHILFTECNLIDFKNVLDLFDIGVTSSKWVNVIEDFAESETYEPFTYEALNNVHSVEETSFKLEVFALFLDVKYIVLDETIINVVKNYLKQLK
jgi:hypothetical protein